jgi:hypothetical protein
MLMQAPRPTSLVALEASAQSFSKDCQDSCTQENSVPSSFTTF